MLSSIGLQQLLHTRQYVHDVRISKAEHKEEERFLRQIALKCNCEQLTGCIVCLVVFFGKNCFRGIGLIPMHLVDRDIRSSSCYGEVLLATLDINSLVRTRKGHLKKIIVIRSPNRVNGKCGD